MTRQTENDSLPQRPAFQQGFFYSMASFLLNAWAGLNAAPCYRKDPMPLRVLERGKEIRFPSFLPFFLLRKKYERTGHVPRQLQPKRFPKDIRWSFCPGITRHKQLPDLLHH